MRAHGIRSKFVRGCYCGPRTTPMARLNAAAIQRDVFTFLQVLCHVYSQTHVHAQRVNLDMVKSKSAKIYCV